MSLDLQLIVSDSYQDNTEHNLAFTFTCCWNNLSSFGCSESKLPEVK